MAKYIHKEAFCLMWYECRECGARARFWNSRDGVTPFGTRCSSCGQSQMYHVFFRSDICVPNHVPWPGQYVWIDLTRERAAEIAEEIEEHERRHKRKIWTAAQKQTFIDSMFAHGTPPDLMVVPFRSVKKSL